MNFRTSISTLCLIFFFLQINAQCSTSNKQSNQHARTVSIQHTSDIIDIAASNENFSTLVVAIKTAGLVETLKGKGPFTVFAPVNSAFARLPEGTVASLLKPDNKDQLTKILTYHVLSGAFYAKDVVNAIKSGQGAFTVKTLSGDELTASLENDTVILTDENGGRIAVLDTDIKAANGVVHVIDSVLLPK